MADRIVVMRDGRIEQIARLTRFIASRPSFVAASSAR
jgi:ABC-type Fe3+/spermidine/putrescine transport system ATPase subunit